MASDPYWAEAPSRKISILESANEGIALRSVPTVPRPGAPFTLIKAEVCRLLPLRSTKVWSGPKPRSWAGSKWSVPSVTTWGVEVKEGAMLLSIWLIFTWGCVFTVFTTSNTSTGTGLSTFVRPPAREPTMSTSSSASASLSKRMFKVVCLPTFTSLVLKPMYENTSTSFSETCRLNCPFSSVLVPFWVFFTTILTPIRGSFWLSVTIPLTVWAEATAESSKAKNTKKRVFFLITKLFLKRLLLRGNKKRNAM